MIDRCFKNVDTFGATEILIAISEIRIASGHHRLTKISFTNSESVLPSHSFSIQNNFFLYSEISIVERKELDQSLLRVNGFNEFNFDCFSLHSSFIEK